MTRVQVRVIGEGDAVRRLVADLSKAAVGAVNPAYRRARSAGELRAYLSLDVPDADEPLVFDGLPTRHRKRNARPEHEERTVAELQARPGEWAHVITVASRASARQTASHIRTGKRSRYRPAGAYDAEHRPARDGSGQWWVYACYVGGGEAS